MAIEIQATAIAEKILKKAGQAGGLPMDQYKELLKKMNDIDGRVEPKGSSGFFHGIDLGKGLRAVFVMDSKDSPVLVYVGDHDGYNKLSDKIRHDPKGIKDQFLLTPHRPIEMPRSSAYNITGDEFAENFRKAVVSHAVNNGYRHSVADDKDRAAVVPVFETEISTDSTLGDVVQAAWEKCTAMAVSPDPYGMAAMRLAAIAGADCEKNISRIRASFHQSGADANPGVIQTVSHLSSGALAQLANIGMDMGHIDQSQQVTLQAANLDEFYDDKGAHVDMGAVLRNPESRQLLLRGLEGILGRTHDDIEHASIADMIEGANLFLGDEEKRGELVSRAEQIITRNITAPASAPQGAVWRRQETPPIR